MFTTSLTTDIFDNYNISILKVNLKTLFTIVIKNVIYIRQPKILFNHKIIRLVLAMKTIIYYFVQHKIVWAEICVRKIANINYAISMTVTNYDRLVGYFLSFL